MHESEATPVLIVDDEEHLRITAGQTLELAGYRPQTPSNAEAALAALSADYPGVLVSDIRMPGMDGLQVLEKANQLHPDARVRMITAHTRVANAVEYWQNPTKSKSADLPTEKGTPPGVPFSVPSSKPHQNRVVCFGPTSTAKASASKLCFIRRNRTSRKPGSSHRL